MLHSLIGLALALVALSAAYMAGRIRTGRSYASGYVDGYRAGMHEGETYGYARALKDQRKHRTTEGDHRWTQWNHNARTAEYATIRQRTGGR